MFAMHDSIAVTLGIEIDAVGGRSIECVPIEKAAPVKRPHPSRYTSFAFELQRPPNLQDRGTPDIAEINLWRSVLLLCFDDLRGSDQTMRQRALRWLRSKQTYIGSAITLVDRMMTLPTAWL
jgi:hypothetical protein